MSTEIKVYLDDTQENGSLCFHATVYGKEDYDVYFDLNNTYEILLLDALKGQLSINYIDNLTFEKGQMNINNDSYEENLLLFKSFLEELYGLNVYLETFELYKHVGVRLVGPGYREGENAPMLEQLQYHARNNLHAIRTALFANNPDFNGDDIYINKATGSLILTLDATKRYQEPIDFMEDIKNDIENETIDPFRYADKEVRERYQSIIRYLSALANQKRLKEFYLIIDGEEYLIRNRKYLKISSENIYFENMELTGIYEGYKKGSDSFEIYINELGKFYCHLNKISKENHEKYTSILEILSQIDVFSSNTTVKVSGKRIKPQTIEVEDIEILQ
jgi:hypothetical protein